MNIDCKNVTSLNNENSSMRNRCYDDCSLQKEFAEIRKIQAIPKQRKIPPMAIEIRLIFSVLTDDEQQRFINYFRLLLAQEKVSMPPASF